MAQKITREALNVGRGIVTGEIIRVIDEEMNLLPGANHPLVDYFGYGEALNGDEDYKHKWLRNQAMEPTLTLAGNWTNSVTSLTVGTHITAADANLLQIGSVIRILPDYGSGQSEESVRVTNVSSSTITIVRDEANENSGTGYAHTAGDRAYILSSAHVDTDEFQRSPYRVGEFVDNYFIQSMYSWDGTDYETLRKSHLEGSGKRLARALTEGRAYALKQLNNQIIYGRKRAPSTSQPGNFSGLREMITTNVVTPSGGIFTPTDIRSAMDGAAKYDESVSNWTVLIHPDSVSILNAALRAYFGYAELPQDARSASLNQLTAVKTDLGTMEIMTVRQMPVNEMIGLANKNDFKLHPGNVDGMGVGWVEMTLGAQFHNARKEEVAVSWIGTSKLVNEARCWKIVGYDPTLSTYAGAI